LHHPRGTTHSQPPLTQPPPVGSLWAVHLISRDSWRILAKRKQLGGGTRIVLGEIH